MASRSRTQSNSSSSSNNNSSCLPFDGEGGDGERGDVDAEVLREHHDGTADEPDDALVDDEKVFRDGRERGGQQHEDVRHGQRHQVAVGRGAHGPGPRHDDHDHHVPDHAGEEDDAHEETADDAVWE